MVRCSGCSSGNVLEGTVTSPLFCFQPGLHAQFARTTLFVVTGAVSPAREADLSVRAAILAKVLLVRSNMTSRSVRIHDPQCAVWLHRSRTTCNCPAKCVKQTAATLRIRHHSMAMRRDPCGTVCGGARRGRAEPLSPPRARLASTSRRRCQKSEKRREKSER